MRFEFGLHLLNTLFTRFQSYHLACNLKSAVHFLFLLVKVPLTLFDIQKLQGERKSLFLSLSLELGALTLLVKLKSFSSFYAFQFAYVCYRYLLDVYLQLDRKFPNILLMESFQPLFNIWLKLKTNDKLRYEARAIWIKFDIKSLVRDFVDERKWFFLFDRSKCRVKYA